MGHCGRCTHLLATRHAGEPDVARPHRHLRTSRPRGVCLRQPGYGLSTRRPGRTQAQTVDDVVAIADELGWGRFAVAGASGGSGPALAVAALIPERVTRCAVIVGVAPSAVEEVRAAMPDDDRVVWEREARGDEEALAEDFDQFLEWFDAVELSLVAPPRSRRGSLATALSSARSVCPASGEEKRCPAR